MNDKFSRVYVLSRYESKDRQKVLERNLSHTNIEWVWLYYGVNPMHKSLSKILIDMVLNNPEHYLTKVNPNTSIYTHLAYIVNNQNDRNSDIYHDAIKWIKNHFRPGYIATTMAHIEAIQRAKSDDLPNVMIIEDDGITLSNFDEIIDDYLNDIPSDWDFLSFGGVVSSWWNPKTRHNSNSVGNGHWIELSNIFCLPCYAIKNTMYDYFIENYQNNYEVIDAFINYSICDERYIDKKKYKYYITYGNLFIANPFIRHSENELGELGRKLKELYDNNIEPEEIVQIKTMNIMKEIWKLNQIFNYMNYVNVLDNQSVIETIF